MDSIALSLRTINCSSRYVALLGLVAHVLNVPGWAGDVRLSRAVGRSISATGQHASMTCRALANLSGSTSRPAFVKRPFSMAAKNGKPAAIGQYPIRIFEGALLVRHH